jgi:hypothetical protein
MKITIFPPDENHGASISFVPMALYVCGDAFTLFT